MSMPEYVTVTEKELNEALEIMLVSLASLNILADKLENKYK